MAEWSNPRKCPISWMATDCRSIVPGAPSIEKFTLGLKRMSASTIGGSSALQGEKVRVTANTLEPKSKLSSWNEMRLV